MPLNYIHTLGDSTLDNLFWMLHNSNDDPVSLEEAKEKTVEGRLQELAGWPSYEVVSHAYDGFTTRSILEGARIGAVLPGCKEKDIYLREKAPSDTEIHPLNELKQDIAASGYHSRHYVVLSVGGNDFRENLLNPWRLLSEISQVQQRYLQILAKIKDLKGSVMPILMLQYRTDANHDPYLIYPLFQIIGTAAVTAHLAAIALLTAPLWALAGKISMAAAGCIFLGGATGLYASHKIVPIEVTKDVLLGNKISLAVFGALLKRFYQPILSQAKKDRIPILDLTNTFNPFKKLYECGIEPGTEGSKLIAEGIHHIVRNHDFEKESALYSKRGPSYTQQMNTNPSHWQVAYPSFA